MKLASQRMKSDSVVQVGGETNAGASRASMSSATAIVSSSIDWVGNTLIATRSFAEPMAPRVWSASMAPCVASSGAARIEAMAGEGSRQPPAAPVSARVTNATAIDLAGSGRIGAMRRVRPSSVVSVSTGQSVGAPGESTASPRPAPALPVASPLGSMVLSNARPKTK